MDLEAVEPLVSMHNPNRDGDETPTFATFVRNPAIDTVPKGNGNGKGKGKARMKGTDDASLGVTGNARESGKTFVNPPIKTKPLPKPEEYENLPTYFT